MSSSQRGFDYIQMAPYTIIAPIATPKTPEICAVTIAPDGGAGWGLGPGDCGFPPFVLLPGFIDPPVALAEDTAPDMVDVGTSAAAEDVLTVKSGTPLLRHSSSVKSRVLCKSSGEQASWMTGRSELM